MELQGELSSEQLPLQTSTLTDTTDANITLNSHSAQPGTTEGLSSLTRENLKLLSDGELTLKIETVLLEKIKGGDLLALFQLGQLYFEQEDYEKALTYFERAAEHGDMQAVFQLGVIYYDGLAGQPKHKKGFQCMLQVAECDNKLYQHLVHAAEYNVGRAYFEGFGVKQSDEMAEKYWLRAADDGNPKASVKAQSTLGMFYSREDSLDLKKAFFWHSEACGNNSLESQGALGVMYMTGVGVKADANAAFICLREAASRGNVYAMGNLVSHYYRRKLYTKCMELAARVAMIEDIDQISRETDCLSSYIRKGIAIAAFYYARCLHLGHGVQKNEAEAKKYYSRSYNYDPDICARLQNITQCGEI